MLAITKTAALKGIEGIEVTVEVDCGQGLPSFHIVGLGDQAIKESQDRVHTSISNCGFDYPRGRVTVNLCPASVRKKGSHYDMAIAVGLMISTHQIKQKNVIDRAFMGELSLEGKFIAVKGVLPMMSGLRNSMIKEVYVPAENSKEAYLSVRGTNIRIVPVASLTELAAILRGDKNAEYYHYDSNCIKELQNCSLDFKDVKGHIGAKTAIITAVSGGHGLLMVGPPGTGKSMLAKRIPTILPEMSADEMIETSMIYSLVGELSEEHPVIDKRPFRALTSRATETTILGGGIEPLPGEVSLANNGILFMDEFLEFNRKQIELLRRPMEEKRVNIIRKGVNYVFPARFTLVGATNPCRCGYYGDSQKACKCSSSDLERYRSRLSGPITDRIDICIEIPRIKVDEINGAETYSSEYMRSRVTEVREIQKVRFKNYMTKTNADMNEAMISEFCILESDAKEILNLAYKNQKLSPRRYNRTLKLARTISDLNGENNISRTAITAALGYTRLFNMYDREE